MSALTRPMYRKYQAAWEEAAAKYGPRTALLYQVGGFFELYDTENLTTGTSTANIRQIAELCQLSLTTHVVEGEGGDKDSQFQTLFGGFPEAALPKFEKILVNAGYTVLVVTQRKGRSGQVEERAVDHIASPGCYVEGARERRLVGVVLESLPGPAALRRVYWAAAALDIATGQSWITEGTDRDRLHQFLCLYAPSELVLWSDGHSDLTESLRGLCAAVHVRALAPAAAAVDHAALERLWAPIHQRLEWLPRLPQARRCVAGLMEFAAEHVPSALRVAPVPSVWVPDGEVRLGNAALEQLGLLSLSSHDEGGASSLLSLMDQCRSIAGRRLMRSRLMRPIADVTEIGRRLDAVDAAAARRKDATVTATTERCLRSLYDLSRLWRRVELGSAGIGDMACLLRAYEAAWGLMDLWPAAPAGCREYLDWVTSRWSAGVATDLAREGVTVPVASLPFVAGSRPAVEAAFAVGFAIRREAEEVCRAWSGLGRAEALYLDDAEGGGFRVTGTKRRISAVWTALRDGGDASASMTAYKNTVLLETAAMSVISERHRKWWVGWQTTWFTAWSEALTELVERGRGAHAALEAWCAELDLSWTVSDLAATWLWKRPEIVGGAAEAFVEVERLRHPILERIVTGPYVTHTVGLQSGLGSGPVGTTPRGLLLYGMNASGKSSLMKALGLAVLLAQCGFPVPAARLRLSPFTAIFTRILGNDNLWAGLSSFAVEMTEFREILRHADERSLVLGDELCSGTESLSATALVAAGVETLANRGTKFVFATHLHELATLPDIAGHSGVRAVHLKVHYDAATDVLVYDRHLAEGSGSALYGLEVCRALDLPPGYLERATAIRQGLAGSVISHVSAYSNGAVVGACEVCGGSGGGLETHHIRHQADAAAAAAEGFDLNAPGNLVCLCATCHDDHHGGRLTIRGWEETSAGRRLVWTRVGVAVVAGGAGGGAGGDDGLTDEVATWIRDQKKRRARVATIQRMVQQLFGATVSEKTIRALR